MKSLLDVTHGPNDGELDVDGEGWLSSVSEAMYSIQHCLERHGAGRVGSEGVLSG